MKKIFYSLLSITTLCCDADRTELPPPKTFDLQKLEARLYGRKILEVTIFRPVPDRPDSTHLRIKNLSGSVLKRLEFFLESCSKESSSSEDCGSDIFISVNPSKPLANENEVTEKLTKFIDLTKSSSIYITSFESDSASQYSIANKYPYSLIKITRKSNVDTITLTGTGKVYMRADGTFFCRGNVFTDSSSDPVRIEVEGTVSKGNRVHASYSPQNGKSLPTTLFGTITDKLISIESDSANTLIEKAEIKLR
ncbi:hypothetical protein [Dyadobacter luticola]|uniref:Uncharacterized protein n=1 Tax=Dyadobacter luticola TaxID=1979387 RepID=A0A5R9KYH8_9BACT|nr:hypothetical protein [Dyadobacter luticola]TLV01324.1 hypothetical protein FEN17_17975 [Dyadobacter luticola]